MVVYTLFYFLFMGVVVRLREMRGKPPKIMLHYYFVTLVTQ